MPERYACVLNVIKCEIETRASSLSVCGMVWGLGLRGDDFPRAERGAARDTTAVSASLLNRIFQKAIVLFSVLGSLG